MYPEKIPTITAVAIIITSKIQNVLFQHDILYGKFVNQVNGYLYGNEENN